MIPFISHRDNYQGRGQLTAQVTCAPREKEGHLIEGETHRDINSPIIMEIHGEIYFLLLRLVDPERDGEGEEIEEKK